MPERGFSGPARVNELMRKVRAGSATDAERFKKQEVNLGAHSDSE